MFLCFIMFFDNYHRRLCQIIQVVLTHHPQQKQGSPLRNSLHLLYEHLAAALADEFDFTFAVETGSGSCQCSYRAEKVPSDRSANKAFDRLVPLVLSNRYAACASAKNVWTSDPGHISYPLSSKIIIQPSEYSGITKL